ncbi:MAG: PAS domain-containing sensor histidine kinase [Alphaproteobacteria bacterium]|nr:PAS domain-containing sensor histidine kinase [Alphaproteobacteria bacterium]
MTGKTSDRPDWDPATYRRVIANAGVGLFETRLDGRYVFANETLAQMLGYPDIEALFADDPKVGERFYADAAQRGEFQRLMARDGRVHDYLIKCRRRDGTLFWVSETSNAIRDATGAVVGYAGALIDVTRRVAAEESFRALFDRVSEGIVRSSPGGRLLRANPAFVQMMGFEREADLIAAVEDAGRQFYVDPARRREFMAAVAESGSVQRFESEVYRIATGERLWVSETMRAIRDETGALLYYEGMVQDVTERRATLADLQGAKESAEAANRSKSRFLANVSHELRTPLNSIIGFSDLMQSRVFGSLANDRYESYVADIHASASMLLQLIDDILDIAKHDAGRLSVRPEAVALGEALEQTVRLMAPRAAQGGVSLHLDAPDPPLSIQADPQRLRQILLNLIGNAVKFTEDGGRVRVTAAQEADRAVITVADTGIGVAPDDLARIFEPFERSESAVGRAMEGAGLGLPLARDLARAHGGDVTIESEPDRGTTARLVLPSAGPAHRAD